MEVPSQIDPGSLLRPGRNITGMSAILLPFNANHEIEWQEFEAHLQRTFAAGLIPAVNMDTGYANLLADSEREEVLERTRQIAAGRQFVAGAFVADHPGAAFQKDRYLVEVERIQGCGGTPIIFQSFGLAHRGNESIVESYRQIGVATDRFLAFELSTQFAPFGKVYDLETYRQLMEIPQCVGAKHSSLSRVAEWERLLLRDQIRPEFKVLTGNDLAIDMVMYGSDYLLGLSTFAPEAFAVRDRLWEERSADFYELNDVLQYLGNFAFRPPVPAYKHSAAMFLNLRGWIKTSLTHPDSPHRPATDEPILKLILERLESKLDPLSLAN